MTFLLGAATARAEAPAAAAAPKPAAAEKWIQLFNGKDLKGWTPKIRGFKLGDNHLDTFRVEGGVIRAGYEKYQTFDGKFGHLAYRKPFSHYRLRIEYRLVGEPVPGAPAWAFRNSGVMLHAQAPNTMDRDQDFPVSIEVQFLRGKGTGERPTANLCTPGTHVVMEGKLETKHCINSTSKTYHGDEWVTVEVEVRGGTSIKHIVDGQTVLSYAEPQYDDADPAAKKLLAKAGGKKGLDRGYIYLQAEGHPVEFRKVELLELRPEAAAISGARPGSP